MVIVKVAEHRFSTVRCYSLKAGADFEKQNNYGENSLSPKLASITSWCSFRGKVCYEPRRPTRPALISGYCSMKRLGVFLPPPYPGWDATPLAGLPPALNSPVERHRDSRVSFPRTQHNVPGQDPNPDHSIRS